MAKGAVVHARVDPVTKAKAQGILNAVGIPLSQAISIFLKQVVYHKGIPFDVRIPNKLTEETLKKTEQGKALHRVSDVDELFDELNA